MMIAYGKITFSLRFIVFTEGLGPPRTLGSILPGCVPWGEQKWGWIGAKYVHMSADASRDGVGTLGTRAAGSFE